VRQRWLPQAQGFVRGLMEEHHADSIAINTAVAELLAGHESPGGFHRRDYHRLHVGPYRVHCIIEGNILNVTRVDKVPS
jgi:hypothetical protein